MPARAALIGTSDGIGLALSQALLERGWQVDGISRSASRIAHDRYQHTVADVRGDDFGPHVARCVAHADTHLVIYCAGIGELFDASRLAEDVATFQTNLLGLARTVEHALPPLLARGRGTFVGLSSMADVLRTRAAPAYGASKAGMSHYLESLFGALRDTGVKVVNVRLGFVDTKLAKADLKPWLLQPGEAAARILDGVLVDSPPRRLNIPRRMAALTSVARWFASRL